MPIKAGKGLLEKYLVAQKNEFYQQDKKTHKLLYQAWGIKYLTQHKKAYVDSGLLDLLDIKKNYLQPLILWCSDVALYAGHLPVALTADSNNNNNDNNNNNNNEQASTLDIVRRHVHPNFYAQLLLFLNTLQRQRILQHAANLQQADKIEEASVLQAFLPQHRYLTQLAISQTKEDSFENASLHPQVTYLKEVASKEDKTDREDLKKLIDTMAKVVSAQSNIDDYLTIYRQLPQTTAYHQKDPSQKNTSCQKIFYRSLLTTTASSPAIRDRIITTLGNFPDHRGKRRIDGFQKKDWQERLKKLVEKVEEIPAGGIGIKSYVLGNEKYALLPNIVKALSDGFSTDPSDKKYIDSHGKFKFKHPRSLSENHLVFSYQGLHFKVFPEFPGIELAIQRFHQRIAGHGTMQSDLWLWESNGERYPVLVSKTIKGETVQKALEKDPRALDKLNMKYFSLRVLVAILINPEDDSPVNEILEIFKDIFGKEIERLISIDNDRPFVPPFEKDHLRVKCILFCCLQMLQSIDPEAREEFLAMGPKEVIQAWIEDLETINNQNKTTFGKYATEFNQSKNNSQRTRVLSMLKEHAVKELYEKFLILQDALRTDPKITLIDLLAKVHPSLANVYRSVLEDPTCHTPVERFNKATDKEYPKNLFSREVKYRSTLPREDYEKSTYGSKPLPTKEEERWQADLNQAKEDLKKISEGRLPWETVRAAIKQDNFDPFLNLPTDYDKEQVIKGIDWEELDLSLQSKLLQAIQRTAFTELQLEECEALDDETLMKLLQNSPNLLSLDLSGCSQLTEKGLQDRILPQLLIHSTLKRLFLNQLPQLKELKSSWWQMQKTIFPHLRELSLEYCKQLKTLEFSAAQLQYLSIIGSPNITKDNLENLQKTCPRLNQKLNSLETPHLPIIKLILRGAEGSVGKSSIIRQFIFKEFEGYLDLDVGAHFHTVNIKVNRKNYVLEIWDANSLSEQETSKLYTMNYTIGGLIFLIYSIDDKKSFRLIESFIPEFRNDNVNLPVILVGNKIDLNDNREVSQEEGLALSKKIGAATFFECSAKTGENIEKLFYSAIEIVLRNKIFSFNAYSFPENIYSIRRIQKHLLWNSVNTPNNEKIFEFKIMLISSYSVGKTCISSRLVHNDFDISRYQRFPLNN